MELQDELITESGKNDREIAVATVRREVVKAICPTLKKRFHCQRFPTHGRCRSSSCSKTSWTADRIQWTQQADMVGRFYWIISKSRTTSSLQAVMLADVQNFPLQHRMGGNELTPLFGFAQQLRPDFSPAVDRGQKFPFRLRKGQYGS